MILLDVIVCEIYLADNGPSGAPSPSLSLSLSLSLSISLPFSLSRANDPGQSPFLRLIANNNIPVERSQTSSVDYVAIVRSSSLDRACDTCMCVRACSARQIA
jgi:hypothetical protein